MIKVNMMVATGALLLAVTLLSFSGSRRPVWQDRTGLAPATSALVQPQNGDAPAAEAPADPGLYSLMGP